jgi:hypothetical protein
MATNFHVSVTDQIQVIIWISLYLITNFLIGFHPFSFNWNIIRLISIIMILYLSYKNLDQSIYLMSLLTPFSKDKIHYAHDFEIKSLNFYQERSTILYLNDLKSDLNDFISNLDENNDFWLSFCFYPDLAIYNIDNGMRLYICDPILVNRDSDPLLLSKFITNRLDIMIDFYYLDDSIFDSEDAVIIAKFTEIELS